MTDRFCDYFNWLSVIQKGSGYKKPEGPSHCRVPISSVVLLNALVALFSIHLVFLPPQVVSYFSAVVPVSFHDLFLPATG